MTTAERKAREYLAQQDDDTLRGIVELCSDPYATACSDTRATFDWNAKAAREILQQRAA